MSSSATNEGGCAHEKKGEQAFTPVSKHLFTPLRQTPVTQRGPSRRTRDRRDFAGFLAGERALTHICERVTLLLCGTGKGVGVVDRRTRRRQLNRTAIQRAALRLFEQQGYEATTVVQIAREAGVSHMTFFRCFPAKEDVVLSDEYDPMLEELVRERTHSRSAVERIHRATLERTHMIEQAEKNRRQ